MIGFWILCAIVAVLMLVCACVWFVIGKVSDKASDDKKRQTAVNKEENLMDRFK
jgi:hypothetical protein